MSFALPVPATAQPAGEAPAAPGSYRADKFMERVGAHLKGVPQSQQRLRFLQAQLRAWERAYARFICASEGDTDPPGDDPPTATDFLLTILGLSAWIERERAGEGRNGR